MRKYLLATDGSDSSLGMGNFLLRASGEGTQAMVTILHVLAPAPYEAAERSQPDFTAEGRWMSHIDEWAAHAAQKVLGTARAALQWPDRHVGMRYALGDAAEVIVNTARDGKYDLVTLGRHPGGAVRAIMLGSVARRVVRASPCPVLLGPLPGYSLRRLAAGDDLRVLVAADGSGASLRAVAAVRNLLGAVPRLRVTILYVEPTEAAVMMVAAAGAEMVGNLFADEAAAESVLGGARVLLPWPDSQVEAVKCSGFPAGQILQVAETGGYDLVAMGRRGLRPWQEMMLGSVSGEVIARCRCPVLIAS